MVISEPLELGSTLFRDTVGRLDFAVRSNKAAIRRRVGETLVISSPATGVDADRGLVVVHGNAPSE